MKHPVKNSRPFGGVKPFVTFDANIRDAVVVDDYIIVRLIDGSCWLVSEDGTKERIEL